MGGTSLSRNGEVSMSRAPSLPLGPARPLAVFVMGPPGSGKSTLSQRLAVSTHFRLIQGGRLLRKMAGSQTISEASLAAKQVIQAGAPIPVPLYCRFVAAVTTRDDESTIFDGYPRDIDQCVQIPTVLGAARIPSANVIGLFLHANRVEVIRRLEHRRVCTNCGAACEPGTLCCGSPAPVVRTDDMDHSLVHARINLYESNSTQIREHFMSRAQVYDVDLAQSDTMTILTSHLMQQCRCRVVRSVSE
jgi:adenylate kinase family enzyme